MSTWYERALLSRTQLVHHVLHMCTTRYSDASTTAMEDDDCGAALRRGQPSRPSHWARTAKQRWALGSAARVREGHECPCTPYDVAVRSRFRRTVPVQRWRRTVAPIGLAHTPGSRLCAAHLSAVLRTRQCGEKVRLSSRTRANEPFVTLTPQLGIEQA